MSIFTNKIYNFITFLLIGAYSVAAQNTITGRVLDAQDSEPLGYTQLALMETADSALVSGGITGESGYFELQQPQAGIYLLRISFIGYDEKWKSIDVQGTAIDLGNMYLTSSSTRLGEVEVSAAAMLFRSEADRRIFNVENMTVAEGGTAIQLLETLPSVQVDEEGGISLRGSGNILIYINGRPTNLTSDETESILEQYPADAIKEVELITNPSARYEAEGIGGIINIILKEERKRGFNGQVNLSAGTGNKYSGGLNANLNSNGWNFTLGYSYQYREFWEVNNTFRENFVSNAVPIVRQDYFTENWRHGHLLRLGTEYEINNNSSIRVYGNTNYRYRDRARVYNIYNYNAVELLDSMYERNLSEDQSRINYETGLNYSWSDNNGRTLLASATYAWDEQDRIEYFDQLFFDADMQEVPGKRADQFYERPLNNNMFVANVDYEQRFNETRRFETGLRSTIRFDERQQLFGQFNTQTQNYEDIVLRGIPVSNHFTHKRDIYAAYVIFSDRLGDLSFQTGLRAEHTKGESWQDYGLRSGFLQDDDFLPVRDTISGYTHFQLFPSLFLSYELAPNHDIQASYSRRIRRPWVGSMMPFLNAQDFYNLRLGNPYLEPEHTDNFELNYIRAWENIMFTGGVFHRYTTNGLSRLFVLFDSGSMITWTNANVRNATGVEVINYFTVNNNFDATLTGNVYFTEVSGEVEGMPFSNESYSWTLSLMKNWSIPNWFSMQTSANYWGPRVIPQGRIKPVFAMNLGFRRNVMNNRATLSFNVSDLLNSRKFALETTGEHFSQEREFYRESRVFTLAFTYRLRDFREQARRNGRDSIDGDVDGLF